MSGLPGPLAGLRIVEIGDERIEYCGMTLAGLGAEVVKIEPPGGNSTRQIGPFFQDVLDPERSLYFWNYNRGKRSIIVDPESADDRALLDDLLAGADVLLESSSPAEPSLLGPAAALSERFPRLVVARMSPFGDTGPWARYKGSDLIHLALGGVTMNCGYDPEPDNCYDLPPIAPQAWNAYHIAGDQLVMGVIAALLYRNQTGQGQDVATAVHQAVATNTELDTMNWVMLRTPVYRRTCRHATGTIDGIPSIGLTKDGRWVMPFQMGGRKSEEMTVAFLQKYGVAAVLTDESEVAAVPIGTIPGSGPVSEGVSRLIEWCHRLFKRYSYDRVPWREAQDAGLLWTQLRKPHENALDDHWIKRGTFASIEHPEIGKSLVYPVSKWVATGTAWQAGRRAPLIDEDGPSYRAGAWREPSPDAVRNVKPRGELARSRLGKPLPLSGVRILDFGWYLAPAGGSRYLAAFGAESLKVEWKSNPDSRNGAMAPVGGREARRLATGPMPGVTDPDMGGQFNNKNPGKRGISLNVRHPKGLEIAKRLVTISDIVAEGFSPGVMDKWGLGYEVLRSIKPDIIYAQQSGFGSIGTYGRYRCVGPVANSLTGMSEMSGLPEPAMPAGWGYSYLDWIAAYSFALAMLSALYHRDRTGEGQWIDSSQCESGIFQTGASVLDWFANGRAWSRYGNRSPYKPAAPHGIYRAAGEDRWIAIACFTEDEWRALVSAMSAPAWTSDPCFATLADRLANQDALDRHVEEWTSTRDRFELMHQLQAVGVPAGVCQTAEDKIDADPQLAELEWLVEVTGKKIGTWPVVEVPVKMSKSPPFIGGKIDRAAPIYGQDNEYVLGELLGMATPEIRGLEEDGVI